jgi:GxxExxY protein
MPTDQIESKITLKHGALTYEILGCFYRVYRQLGAGFLESVYLRSLMIELQEAGLSAVAEVPVPVWFKGHDVGQFRADIVVENLVLLELKAAEQLCKAHEAQLVNYLRATKLEIGLLLNFGPKPQFRRFVFENERKASALVRAVSVHPR